MEIIVADSKGLEKHNFLIKTIRIFTVPLLNVLPPKVIRGVMKFSHKDSAIVLEDMGSANAMEIIYRWNGEKLFSRGFLNGVVDLFWHRCLLQPGGLRNRLRIVQENLSKEIIEIIKRGQKNIDIATIGGGSAREIIQTLTILSKKSDNTEIRVVNIDKSLASIELGKNAAEKLGLARNFKWINDSAENIKSILPNGSADIVEMVGLLDYFSETDGVKIVKQIYNILKDGGMFIVGNVAPNKEESFVSRLGWPKMHYRNPDDLIKILISSGFSEEKGKIIFDPLKNHIVAVIKK